MRSENDRDTLQPRPGTSGVYDAPTLTVDPSSEQIRVLLEKARAADRAVERMVPPGFVASPAPSPTPEPTPAPDASPRRSEGSWVRPALGFVVALWTAALVVLWFV